MDRLDSTVLLNPFPGLRPFREDEEHLFFGRESQVDTMIDKLARTRFLAVVGTSGSGKSSLVNSGLRPALHRGLMARAGTSWRMVQFRPGSNPVRAMARALAREGALFSGSQPEGVSLVEIVEATLRMSKLGLADVYEQAQLGEGVKLLVVVDQFEELFRYSRTEAASPRGEQEQSQEAIAFVNLLLEAHAQANAAIYIVLTMRSDFLGDCAQFPGLAEAINDGQYLVPRLTREERRAAISGPVGVGGGQISPVLLTRLVNDVGDNPDQLSILQHALNRTWARWQHDGRSDGPMSLPHYEAIGTMAHALDQHAEKAYSELGNERQQKICEKIFKALTDRGSDARGIRRPTSLATLCALAGASPADVTEVIDVFRKPSRSFLMPPLIEILEPDTVIDISHESLMRIWERLGAWADEEAQSAQRYRRLSETAAEHMAGKAGLLRDPELQLSLDWRKNAKPNAAWGSLYGGDFDTAIRLFRDPDLQRALESREQNEPNRAWVRRYHPDFDGVMNFLEESQAAQEKEVKDKERLRQRELKKIRLIAAILGVILLCFVSLFWYADRQRKEAERQRQKVIVEQYGFNTILAHRAHENLQFALVQELLHTGLPTLGTGEQRDPRGFEWYYLWRLYHQESATLRGHSKPVWSVAFSPDGGTLATGSIDTTVKLWDTSTRREIASLEGHRDALRVVVFSPDGKTLATGSNDRTVKLWDTSTRKEIDTVKGHESPVLAVAFSPDGKILVSAGEDKTVKLWDTSTRKEIATLKGHESAVWSVAFSPDGKTLATGSEDTTAKLWDMSTRKEIASLEGHQSGICAVAFSPDHKTLATSSDDKTVKLWDTSTREKPQAMTTLQGHSSYVGSLAFSHDGKVLATGSDDSTVKLWDTSKPESPREIVTLKGHSSFVMSVAFSSDNKTLATGSLDHTVKLWDTSTPKDMPILEGHLQAVEALAFSPDRKILATASSDKTVALWDMSTPEKPREMTKLKGHSSFVGSVAFSSDGKVLATGSADKTVKLWDPSTLKEIAILQGHRDSVRSVAFSPEGQCLATGSLDQTVKLWDRSALKEIATLKGHSDSVRAVVFSPDGKVLATGSNDRTVKLWDSSRRQEISTLKGHESPVLSVAFSPDGKTLATGSEDKTIKLWDLSTRQEIATLKGHDSSVWAVAFSPDGKTLATGSEDTTVKLWGAHTGREMITLKGHKSGVRAVAFSPDSRILATGSEDNTVRLWVGATGKEVDAQTNGAMTNSLGK